MPVKASVIAPPKKRRPPYFETVLLITVAAVGLFLFTRLRFHPHSSPRPAPARPVSTVSHPEAQDQSHAR